ncbi:hypothetical protein EYF80_054210 [Liparis tanakae]|uniref:Uncharacterized protein n=1 Tax=Liparis tanakae TaxID=230148 RepID=A0A4Z2F392_9TELE|nr:hypothetical protein EYF80_054210 [Liparis tanakae]
MLGVFNELHRAGIHPCPRRRAEVHRCLFTLLEVSGNGPMSKHVDLHDSLWSSTLSSTLSSDW